MPSIKWTDNSPEGKKREALIKKILPKEPLVDSYLQPRLMEAMDDVLIKTLCKEIEIYRAYPKKGKFQPTQFEPRTPSKCFMGQAFTSNGRGFEGWYDADLVAYRKAIGTIDHVEWGSCTLLEIWAGDHINNYPDMVKGVFMYGWNEQTTMPDIHFYVNPFYKNPHSGTMILSEEAKQDSKYFEHMSKLVAYVEIRDRMKKNKIKNIRDLKVDPEEDPIIEDWEEEDEE